MGRFQRFLVFMGVLLGIGLVLFLLLAPDNLFGGNSSTGNAGQNTPSPSTPPATGISAVPSGKPGVSACPPPLDTVSPCLTPKDLRSRYGIESLLAKGFTGEGQTVVLIVSFGSPTLQQDMDVYNKTFGLPPVDLEVISPLEVPENDPQQTKSAWTRVTTLSVQMVHAIAPLARIVVLTSPIAELQGTIGLGEFRRLVEYALDHQLGEIILQNWGVSEATLQSQSGQDELERWEKLFKEATTQKNITFLAPSGNTGATSYADLYGQILASKATINFPAASPWVTAVGGTSLTMQDTHPIERAWSGSGGGSSQFVQVPEYQKQLPVQVQQQMKEHRAVPDVAALAGPETGLVIYHNGQWERTGGTGVSTAIWAGMLVIANQIAGHPLGFINPTLYSFVGSDTYAQNFRDITDGNNTNQKASVQGYPAIAGWDAVTGLGVPVAEKLLPDLVAGTSSP